ncbi:hypothetical protein D3C73_1603100 [compost metagenome]
MFELIRENVGRIVATEHERDKLLKEGFTLVEPQQEEDEKSIDDMTVPELKAYAEKNSIELGEAKLKEEIQAKIKGV